MALTDQPYLPLYVDDWMNNSKLKLCSPGAHGLMISIMCIMHKSDSYGVILLKQKFKQTDKQETNFALQIAKLSTFDLLEIEKFFYELLEEKVLKIEGDSLICSRMVKDASISKKRASSGKTGGEKTQKSIKNFAKANTQANTGIGNDNEIVTENDNEIEKKEKAKNNFQEIVSIFNSVCSELPQVVKITEARKSAIKKIIKENGPENLGTVFDKVSKSDYLNGHINGWKADFDWILKTNNFIKILEGNYDNKIPKNNEEKPMIGRMTQSTAEKNFFKFANVKIPGADGN